MRRRTLADIERQVASSATAAAAATPPPAPAASATSSRASSGIGWQLFSGSKGAPVHPAVDKNQADVELQDQGGRRAAEVAAALPVPPAAEAGLPAPGSAA